MTSQTSTSQPVPVCIADSRGTVIRDRLHQTHRGDGYVFFAHSDKPMTMDEMRADHQRTLTDGCPAGRSVFHRTSHEWGSIAHVTSDGLIQVRWTSGAFGTHHVSELI